MSLVVVTASTNLDRARSCIESWGDVPKVIVLNGPGVALQMNMLISTNITLLQRKDYLGTVPAFMAGVDYVLEHHPEATIIACLHDDLEISDPEWVRKVEERFARQPEIGLLGFGGAIGVGDHEIYQKPYQPVQLARVGFRSNLVDAEVHGMRSLLAEQVACLDGFCQIGRRAFWAGEAQGGPRPNTGIAPWHILNDLKIVHHAYDTALGLIAAQYGWETWYLPMRCRHWGGQTAVGDAGYQKWAQTQTAGGDHGFWEQAHEAIYYAFRQQLPLRV